MILSKCDPDEWGLFYLPHLRCPVLPCTHTGTQERVSVLEGWIEPCRSNHPSTKNKISPYMVHCGAALGLNEEGGGGPVSSFSPV